LVSASSEAHRHRALFLAAATTARADLDGATAHLAIRAGDRGGGEEAERPRDSRRLGPVGVTAA